MIMAFGQNMRCRLLFLGCTPGYGDDGLRPNVERQNSQLQTCTLGCCRTIAHGHLVRDYDIRQGFL